MISLADTLPELVQVDETDPAAARRARRLAGRGRLASLSAMRFRVFPCDQEIQPRHDRKILILLVGRLGLEPRTKALKGPCSTN